MFEQSDLYAAGRNKRTKFVALSAAALQIGLVAGYILTPLIWPATMPTTWATAKMKTVSLAKARPKPILVKPQLVPKNLEAKAFSAPSTHTTVATVQSPRGGMVTHPTPTSLGDSEPRISLGGGMGTTFSFAAGPGTGFGTATGPNVTAAHAPPTHETGPVRVSTGVSNGLLLAPIRPIYPMIAKASHTQGTVIVTATIDRSGKIVGLQILSGPDMLRNAAADAIREARYRPYLLNGQPTEVITLISVTFTIAG